jgi:hypothetical protein
MEGSVNFTRLDVWRRIAGFYADGFRADSVFS